MTDQATRAGQPPTSQAGASAASDVDRRLEALPFDRALAELQSVVNKLEAGNLPLEESIALYEQGVRLHERCARLLGQAELRVQRLVESAGGQLRALDLSLGETDES